MSCVSSHQDQGRKRSRQRHTSDKRKKRNNSIRISDLDNFAMAYFSETKLWDEFELPVEGVDLDLGEIMDADSFGDFENLASDYGLSSATEPAVKVEVEENSDLFLKQITDFKMEAEDNQNDFDLFDSLDLDAADESAAASELDTIKSDCMWSSILNNDLMLTSTNNQRRRRDFSLTLSENEGLFSVDMLSTSPLTGINAFSLNSFIETPLTTSASESDTESTSTDEEIDVVTSEDGYTNPLLQQQQQQRHQLHFNRNNINKKPVQHIEPGRSLLLSRNRSPKQQPQPQQQQPQPETTFTSQAFIDHSYFLVRPPSPRPSETIQGMLTPTESSDDDEMSQVSFSPVMPSTIDKRKIAQAVQSLIKNQVAKQSSTMAMGGANRRPGLTDSNIKFKFRMKFKSSGQQQHSLLSVNNRHHIRRKSASLNTHCPSQAPSLVTGQSVRLAVAESIKSESSKVSVSPVKGGARNIKSSRTSSSGSSSTRSSPSSQEQKCREIRDLHNSMERQRRVDLRKNFDQLKSVVPELADTEKASKLNILNKASEYCRLLATTDARLRRDVDKESARNAMLRKKLAALTTMFNNHTVTASTNHGIRLSTGRVTLAHSRARDFVY